MTEEPDIDKRVVQTYWDERAPLANDPRSVTLDNDPEWWVRVQLRIYQQWFERNALDLAPRPLRLSVDVGCGTGDWSVLIARHTEQQFVACDLSANMLGVCRNRIEASSPALAAQFVQSDLGTMALPERADLIVAGGVLQYANQRDIERFIAAARASLSPTGVLYLRTTIAKSAASIHNRTDDYDAMYRPRAFYDQAIEKAGLEVVRSSYATQFVPQGLTRVVLPGPLWWLFGWFVSPILSTIWRLKRRRMKTDVLAVVARVPAAP